jgi:hypothetical protein
LEGRDFTADDITAELGVLLPLARQTWKGAHCMGS